MSLTLAIADNQDGTGGVGAITGSDPATVNTLYRAQFQGQDGPLVWQQAGTCTGDGTIVVGGPTRTYWLWYVAGTVGGLPAVSPVVQQALTDATYQAVRTRAIAAIVDRFKLLDLEDITGDRIYVRSLEDDPVVTLPGLVIVRDLTPDRYQGGTNVRDDVGYPVQCLFKDQGKLAGENDAQLAKWDLWREKGERAFRYQRLPGLPESLITVVEPALALQPDKKVYEKVVTAFTVRVVSREVRGIQV